MGPLLMLRGRDGGGEGAGGGDGVRGGDKEAGDGMRDARVGGGATKFEMVEKEREGN